jgi:hypothetical protein
MMDSSEDNVPSLGHFSVVVVVRVVLTGASLDQMLEEGAIGWCRKEVRAGAAGAPAGTIAHHNCKCHCTNSLHTTEVRRVLNEDDRELLQKQ